MPPLSPDAPTTLRFDAQQLATLRALGEYGSQQTLFVPKR